MIIFNKYSFYDLEKKYNRLRNELVFLSECFVPNLIDVQLNSYHGFLGKIHAEFNLEGVFRSIFPIVSYTKYNVLEYISYSLGESIFSINECKLKGKTYSVSLKIKVRLVIYDKNFLNTNVVKKFVEQDIYICELPVMTSYGSFIINGIERVVVSQLQKSPGVLFESSVKTYGRRIFSARIIPYRGSWLDFELDCQKNYFTVRIDRKKKFNITILLKALGYSVSNILNLFFDFSVAYFNSSNFLKIITTLRSLCGECLAYDLWKEERIILKKGTKILDFHLEQYGVCCTVYFYTPLSFLYTKILAVDIVDSETNIIILHAGSSITESVLKNLILLKIDFLYFVYYLNVFSKESILFSLDNDIKEEVKIISKLDALFYIHRILRPNERPTQDSATGLFYRLFFDSTKYDLSSIGVFKFNRRFGINLLFSRVLTRSCIVFVLKKLLNICNSSTECDDIDDLINRRVRCVGELIENQFRIGFTKIENSIKEKLTYLEDGLVPKDLINTKLLVSTLNEFFFSDQLSQFMDQTNPISWITHQRRVSSFGLGGLTREHAGFEVRDVHYSYYGRLCPVETPEGQNIGLVNSLSLYSRVNSYGFLETPYYKVELRKVSNRIFYLSALEEKNCIIAQADVIVSHDRYLISSSLLCRYNDVFKYFNTEDVNYIDISSQQVFSVTASLIPFLEHNDANRALMGSNMQRQSVPLLFLETPLVGTGIENIFSRNTLHNIFTSISGLVCHVTGSEIIIKFYHDCFRKFKIKLYDLIKYAKTNQNTCINQKTLVSIGECVKKGNFIADGFCTHFGELALGKNILVGFMSWYGFNFEDSIVVSERLIIDDVFTSVHIEEFVCFIRETRFGSEFVTCDIPNVNQNAIKNLDEFGIIYIGSEVSQGDILVGKVTPLGDITLTPEEKLLKAIFREKVSDVKDSSLRVPIGILEGSVLDVQVYSKISKNFSFFSELNKNFLIFKNKLFKTFYLEKQSIFRNLKKFLLGKKLLKCKFNFFYGFFITQKYLHLFQPIELFSLVLENCFCQKILSFFLKKFESLKYIYKDFIKKYRNDFCKNESLAIGVLKVVKVFLAVKRVLKVGDKMSGRHGNKGVVSVIVPKEDMPYLHDGTSFDMILNPLSVPSRMNIGQIFEAHLGLISKFIGNRLYDLFCLTKSRYILQEFLEEIYELCGIDFFKRIDFFSFTDYELLNFLNILRNGFPLASPIFCGFNFKVIKKLFKFFNLPQSGQIDVYDGLSGKLFRQRVTVGFVYMLKLNHLVDDKIHARSIGSYSLITQQPLGGRAQFGGQRFGEMEVWALEAYGAAYILQEMLTIKSDDVTGRVRVYKNIVDNDYYIVPGIPESFNVLVKEIRSLGLNIEFK